MSTHNICFRREKRKILCGYPLLSVAMFLQQQNTDFFSLFHDENMWCSLEAPPRGSSNEYPQHMFLWRNRKNIIWIPALI